MKLLQLFVVMLGLAAFGCEAQREAEPVRPEGAVEAPAEGERPAVEEVEPEKTIPPAEKPAP